MHEVSGQRYHVETWPNVQQLKLARAEIRAMQNQAFDRYESPFEAKLTLRDKSPRTLGAAHVNAWSSLMAELESNEWLEYVSGLFGVELVADRWRHYAGVFRYLPDDHLGVHVDAAIHPISGLRKHVTLVLYLGAGAGNLELWRGSSCVDSENPDPYLIDVIDSVVPALGTVVMFECNDYGWHGTAKNTHPTDDRLVVTVSYLSSRIAPHEGWMNQRQRAFFVPRPNEEWSPETYALRDRRADPERYAEAYRAG